MTAVLAAAAVGLRANFTGLAHGAWTSGARIVFRGDGLLMPEDATVHRVRSTGKYSEVWFSEPPKQLWPAGALAVRKECGTCQDPDAGFTPSSLITECAMCYWPKTCLPVTYPVLPGDVEHVEWTYHMGHDGDALSLFRGLDADRRFVYGCEDCAGWNRSSSTLSLRMAVVSCVPEFSEQSAPMIKGFSPVYHPHHHHYYVSRSPSTDAVELAVVVALMLATAIIITGVYWSLAFNSKKIQKVNQ